MRTRDNLSKVCREWKTQQKILWTGVWEESGGGGGGSVHHPGPPCRWEMSPGGTRLSRHYGRGKGGSHCGGQGEQGAGMGALGAPGAGNGVEDGDRGAGCRGGATAIPTHTRLHGIRRRGLGGRSHFPFVISFVLHSLGFVPFVISLVRLHLGTGMGGGQWGACNVPPPREQRTGEPDKTCAAIA